MAHSNRTPPVRTPPQRPRAVASAELAQNLAVDIAAAFEQVRTHLLRGERTTAEAVLDRLEAQISDLLDWRADLADKVKTLIRGMVPAEVAAVDLDYACVAFLADAGWGARGALRAARYRIGATSPEAVVEILAKFAAEPVRDAIARHPQGAIEAARRVLDGRLDGGGR